MSGYIGNTPVPDSTRTIKQGIMPGTQNYLVVPGGYTVGSIMVYVDGLRLNGTQYTAMDGMSIIFDREYSYGTDYMVEEIVRFQIQDVAASSSPVAASSIRYPIMYTTDLWNDAVVNPADTDIGDTFDTLFYDGGRQLGTGGSWQVVSLTGSPPSGGTGHDTDGSVYVEVFGNFIQLKNITPLCSTLQYGKPDACIKNLYKVCGGFDNQPIILTGLWEPGDEKGGVFFWSGSTSKTLHNGDNIIDPDRVQYVGSGPSLPSQYTTPGISGEGCWVKVSPGC